ncbi:MAG: hypothetical protein G01um101429_932 [Parcubacteria group bacterium Gr01-1014_29]|nr:MAG: hypothetical protein G01um101429_932 [Parcubacteria group bacterium Gr01-1014_29]
MNTVLALYKAFAFIVTLVSVAGIIFVGFRSVDLRRRYQEKKMRAEVLPDNEQVVTEQALTALQDATTRRWRAVVERLGTEDQKDFKTAIIEADGLVDAALRAYEFPGESMGERMQAVTRERLPSINDLWQAHKVRNAIAHDPHYSVSPREGHDIMRIYKKILEELGIL